MLTQRLANIVFAILILAATAWFAKIATGFEATGLLASSGLPSKFFPLVILGFIAVCAVIVLATYAFKRAAGGDDGKTVFGHRREAVRGVTILGVALACYLIWARWGFVPMAIVMGPASALAMGVRSLPIYVVVSALTVAVYLVFSQLLGIRLQ